MKHINFIANSNKFFIISTILVVLALVLAFAVGINLDIQFEGGSIITYSYEGNLDVSAFVSKNEEILGQQVSHQTSFNRSTDSDTIIISLPGNQSLDVEEMAQVITGLQEAFPDNNVETMEISNVDPTIGSEFLAKCLTAVAVASILMVLYVALRFRKIGGLSAGAMAVVALIHDVIIVFGVFVIFGLPINDNFIAVVLTILGYSLNDTIVIYDRIRENRRMLATGSHIGEVVDKSINQSFKRSLMTSITTVLVMTVVTVVAYLYNVDSILTFSFPLIIGLISGSYSSLCLAGPLWVKWREHRDKASA